jgi:hypothetical protein
MATPPFPSQLLVDRLFETASQVIAWGERKRYAPVRELSGRKDVAFLPGRSCYLIP